MQLKCQNCGAPLTYSNGLYLCEYCGSQVANEELPQIQLEIDKLNAELIAKQIDLACAMQTHYILSNMRSIF